MPRLLKCRANATTGKRTRSSRKTPFQLIGATNPHKLAQKDVEARWTKKDNERHYGYKNHINADHATELVRGYQVTDASVHDTCAPC